MYEANMSFFQLLFLLTVQKPSLKYEYIEDLLLEIHDKNLVNTLAQVIPAGIVNPAALRGVYIENLLMADLVNINKDILQLFKQKKEEYRKNLKIKFESYHLGDIAHVGLPCPESVNISESKSLNTSIITRVLDYKPSDIYWFNNIRMYF